MEPKYVESNAIKSHSLVFRLYPSLIWVLIPVMMCLFLSVFLMGVVSKTVLICAVFMPCITLATVVTLPVVKFSSQGYTIQRFLKPTLKVSWDDICTVMYAQKQQAMAIVCKTSEKNLLIPPLTGYGYFFFRRTQMISWIATNVASKIALTNTLDDLASEPLHKTQGAQS